MDNTKNSYIKTWKKILCVILSLIIAIGTFVTMIFSNLYLSDYVDLQSLITVHAATINPVPVFYRHGELVGLYRVDYTDKTKLQYKIGEDGEWTDYSVPFSIPAFKTTKVYARIGTTGKITYMNFSTTDEAIGVYTEENTDFEFSYNGIDFGYTRIYNSVDKNWFESIHSKVLATNSRLEVTLPDNTKYPMIRKDANTYVDELNGYTMTKTSSNYIFDDGQYKYYFPIKALQSVTYLGAIEDYNGNKLNLNRTTSSNEISISDASGRKFYISDYYGIEAPDGSDVNYYSVKEITDPNGNKIEYTTKYDRYIQVKDQAGAFLGKYEYKNELYDYTLVKSMDKTIDYYDNGRLKQITYDDGSWTRYTYDDANMTYTILTSSGEITKIVYNDAFFPVKYIDEYGQTTTYTYDNHYRVLTETKGAKITTYTYDINGNVLSWTTSNTDNDTHYTYNSSGKVVREQNGTNNTYYVYDNNGNVLIEATLKEDYIGEIPSIYDASLTCFDKTEYNYDNNGRIIKEENSTGKTTEYEYDKFGNIIKEIYKVTENEKTETLVTTYMYDELGNLLSYKCDDDNASYIYDAAGRTLLANENGNYTRTMYDEYGRIVQKIAPEDYDKTKDGLPDNNTYADSNAGNRYIYNENNQLIAEINRLGVETLYEYYSTGEKKIESFDIYDLYYNKSEEVTKVYVNGVNTVSYNYDDNNNLISKVYANGDSIRYEYNDNRYLNKQYHNDNTTPYVTYTYNEDGELVEKVNTDTGLKYVYDENSKVNVYRTSDNTLVQSYTETVTEANEEADTEAKTDITEIHFGTTYSSVVMDKSVLYTAGLDTVENIINDDDYQTTSDVVNYNNNTVISSKYTYDDNGNITKKALSYGNSTLDIVNSYDDKDRIVATGYGETTEYFTYDNDSQIIRIDNSIAADINYTSTYTYDSRGNITSRNVYNYTRNENITTSPKETTTFTYANSGWIDQLVAVNDVELTYDSNGNVLTFGDKEYTWNTGRHLESITDGKNTYSYTYDENEIRTSKTVNGVTTYYNTKGNVILSQTDGTNTMYFQYDTNGIPIGFIYNGTQYFYMTNPTGDVISITNDQGKELVEYEYDEWGKNISIYTPDNTEEQVALAEANPLRYRGYYYDTETGYYYLQSRYYDPSICRFINSDLPEIAQQSKEDINGLNIFAYCDNDPTNSSDCAGYWGSDVHSGYNLRTWLHLYEFDNSSLNYGTYYWAQRVGFSENFAYFIGYWCNYVDTKYDPLKPTQANNSWHFNSNWYTGYPYDTRDTHSNDMIKKAKQELKSANAYYKKNKSVYKDHLRQALIYIGYSLHPIQDKYSHTKSVSHLLAGSRRDHIIYFHLSGVDDANKHKTAVNNTGVATKNILKQLYNNYSLLKRKDLKFYVK